MHILILAWRQMLRQGLRSWVTMLAMVLACGIMIVFAALMEGMLQGSERNVVAMNLGDMQVHAPGYLDDPDLYTRISRADDVLQVLEDAGFDASPRLYTHGLAAADVASAGVQLRGVDLVREPTVTQLYQHVLHGAWLSVDDASGVVIGKKLATILGVTVGDEIVFIGQSSDGYMADAIWHVRGILKSVSDGIDRSGIFIAITPWRELMAMPDGVHEVVIRRPNPEQALESATAQVRDLLPELDTRHWKDRMPLVARMLDMADIQTMIMILITYVAVGIVVLNAMLMNVLERLHEFGVMKALGASPRQIVAMIYAESTMQTLIASVVAAICGIALARYYEVVGIDLRFLSGSFSFAGIAFEPIWHASLTPMAVAMPVVFLFVISAISVAYPAWKASRALPVIAMRKA